MKITFRGWRREKTQHERALTPVSSEKGKYEPGRSGDPIAWHTANKAFARIDELGLSGSFLLELQWEDTELHNWLEKYVAEKPEAAVRVLSAMLAEAVLVLHSRHA